MRMTEPAGTANGFSDSRRMSVRSEREASSSLRILRHSPSPPVGRLAGKDWSARMKTEGQL